MLRGKPKFARKDRRANGAQSLAKRGLFFPFRADGVRSALITLGNPRSLKTTGNQDWMVGEVGLELALNDLLTGLADAVRGATSDRLHEIVLVADSGFRPDACASYRTGRQAPDCAAVALQIAETGLIRFQPRSHSSLVRSAFLVHSLVSLYLSNVSARLPFGGGAGFGRFPLLARRRAMASGSPASGRTSDRP
jgi:hypothetical protein